MVLCRDVVPATTQCPETLVAGAAVTCSCATRFSCTSPSATAFDAPG